jgi:transposase
VVLDEKTSCLLDRSGASSGQRAANVMSLIQIAKIRALDPQAYLRDLLERLPSTKYPEIDSLLPHNWSTAIKV